MTLADRAQAVQTREDLVVFLEALRADFRDNGHDWTNPDLASFLEAMEAWIGHMEGYFARMGQDMSKLPPWRLLADVLMAARIYE